MKKYNKIGNPLYKFTMINILKYGYYVSAVIVIINTRTGKKTTY